MSRFYYNSPARSDELHIANQKPGIQSTPMRYCTKCNRPRSIAQFWNAKKNPIFKFCQKCRGGK